MLIIPIISTPSQSLNVSLANQNCSIEIYQKSTGLFLDLYIDGNMVLQTALCHDRVKLIREQYYPFIGNLSFMDMQGTSDPDYTGLGIRYLLLYLEVKDL